MGEGQSDPFRSFRTKVWTIPYVLTLLPDIVHLSPIPFDPIGPIIHFPAVPLAPACRSKLPRDPVRIRRRLRLWQMHRLVLPSRLQALKGRFALRQVKAGQKVAQRVVLVVVVVGEGRRW